MHQKEEIIKLVKNHYESLDLKNRDDVYESSTAILSLCQRFYKNESAFQKELEMIRSQIGVLLQTQSDDFPVFNLETIKNLYKRLLNSIISEIENFGLPSKNDIKIDKSVNVNVNQSQSQHQKMELSFLIDIFKDELNGRQLKELGEIVENESEPKIIKEKLGAKLIEFGVNVTAGILSSILSNPTIWSMIN
jgi:hypothetical protein